MNQDQLIPTQPAWVGRVKPNPISSLGIGDSSRLTRRAVATLLHDNEIEGSPLPPLNPSLLPLRTLLITTRQTKKTRTKNNVDLGTTHLAPLPLHSYLIIM